MHLELLYARFLPLSPCLRVTHVGFHSSSLFVLSAILSLENITVHLIHSPIDGHLVCFHFREIRIKSCYEHVKSRAGSEALPHLQDNKLPHHRFVDAGRRQASPAPDTEGFIAHSNSVSICTSALSPISTGAITGPSDTSVHKSHHRK